MAAYNKFLVFTKHLVDGVHDFDNHAFKVMLTNTSPVNTNTVKADITEVGAGNGYSAGGLSVTMATSTSSGTAKVTVTTDIVFTAAAGSIGPFRYAVLYNDTATQATKPLIAWWDYGASITLNDSETLTVDFDQTNGILTVS
jgi:hypothetical protein